METQVVDYNSYFKNVKIARTLCYICMGLCGARFVLGVISLLMALIPLPGPLALIALTIALACFALKIMITGSAITVYVFSIVKNVKLLMEVNKFEACSEADELRAKMKTNRRISKLTGLVLLIPLVVITWGMGFLELILLLF